MSRVVDLRRKRPGAHQHTFSVLRFWGPHYCAAAASLPCPSPVTRPGYWALRAGEVRRKQGGRTGQTTRARPGCGGCPRTPGRCKHHKAQTPRWGSSRGSRSRPADVAQGGGVHACVQPARSTAQRACARGSRPGRLDAAALVGSGDLRSLPVDPGRAAQAAGANRSTANKGAAPRIPRAVPVSNVICMARRGADWQPAGPERRENAGTRTPPIAGTQRTEQRPHLVLGLATQLSEQRVAIQWPLHRGGGLHGLRGPLDRQHAA